MYHYQVRVRIGAVFSPFVLLLCAGFLNVACFLLILWDSMLIFIRAPVVSVIQSAVSLVCVDSMLICWSSVRTYFLLFVKDLQVIFRIAFWSWVPVRADCLSILKDLNLISCIFRVGFWFHQTWSWFSVWFPFLCYNALSWLCLLLILIDFEAGFLYVLFGFKHIWSWFYGWFLFPFGFQSLAVCLWDT